jgi:hypothetical protein
MHSFCGNLTRFSFLASLFAISHFPQKYPANNEKNFMVHLCVQRNKLRFPKSKTANLTFKYRLLFCGKDNQFVFPNFSFFHFQKIWRPRSQANIYTNFNLWICMLLSKHESAGEDGESPNQPKIFYRFYKTVRTLLQHPLFVSTTTIFLTALFLML